MKQPLQRLNLFGIVAMASLSVMQWRSEHRLRNDGARMQAVILSKSALLDAQAHTITQKDEDLEDFCQRLELTHTELQKTQTDLALQSRLVQQLALERDGLKAAVAQWISAVTARDSEIQRLNAALKQTTSAENAAVQKFNKLADDYNLLIKSNPTTGSKTEQQGQ